MNKIFSRTLLTLVVSGFVIVAGTNACSDFFEPDLINDTVILNSPADGYTTNISSVTFWWNEVEGATGYRLQIVSPSYDSIQRMITDSIVKKTSITYNLLPGRYEWSISAINNSSTSIASYRHLAVDTSSALAGIKVVLLAPSGGAYLSKTNINFKWFKLENASKYIFEIRKNNESGEMVFPSQISINDTLSLNLDEGVYYWSIQALNQTSGSMLSGRMLYIDKTSPSTPVLYTPYDNDTVKVKDVVLVWKRPSLSLAPISDSIFLAKDSTFSVVSILESALVDTTIYNVITNDQGIYYWRVRSLDAAGNFSGYSKIRKFRIQNAK